MSALEIVGVVMIAWALGVFVGHAAGYARRGDVERRRQAAALTGAPRQPRRARVGSPE